MSNIEQNLKLWNKILIRKGVSYRERVTIGLQATGGVPSADCFPDQLEKALVAFQRKWLELRAEEIFSHQKEK